MPEKNRVSSVATNTTWFSFNDVTDDGQGLCKYQDAIMHNLKKIKLPDAILHK